MKESLKFWRAEKRRMLRRLQATTAKINSVDYIMDVALLAKMQAVAAAEEAAVEQITTKMASIETSFTGHVTAR